MIETNGRRGSGKSVLAIWHDDIYIYIYIYIYVYISSNKGKKFIDKFKPRLNKTWIIHVHKWTQNYINMYIYTLMKVLVKNNYQYISNHTIIKKNLRTHTHTHTHIQRKDNCKWNLKPHQHTHTHTHTNAHTEKNVSNIKAKWGVKPTKVNRF